MALYEQGNYTKARLEFKNVLQIDPKDAQSYYMFATIEEKNQNWRKAYALFLRTTELWTPIILMRWFFIWGVYTH